MDRISSLPDGVISHILSFLPTKKAARTSVLSKRWRILFAFSPNLDFKVGNNRQSFIDFVDRLLAVSGDSPIKKFALTCRKGSEPAHFDRWICDVLNRGVLVLDLAIYDVYPVTVEVFTCKTIVKLTLFNFLIEELPVDAFLPALRYIFLDDVHFGSLHVCAFEKLLSDCTVLEDLLIFGLEWEQWKLSCTITSP